MGITSIGVGVVVVDPRTEKSRFEFREDNKHFGNEESASTVRRAIKQFKSELKAMATDSATLGLDGVMTVRSYLDFASSHWFNLLRVDSVRTMDAPSLQVATDRLFSVLIGEPPSSTRAKDVRHLRSAVCAEYKRIPRLEKATQVSPGAVVVARDFELNLAVVEEGQVFELNQAFNFQAENTLAQVDVWTLKLDKLRQNGGTLKIFDERLNLDKEVEVTAAVYLPQTEPQQEVYEKFQQFCDGLDVQILPETALREHTEVLARRLVS